MDKEEREFLQHKAEQSNFSRDIIKDLNKQGITVTMVGALNAIEKDLGFLWKGDSDLEIKYKKIYEGIRNRILSTGNDQIRKFDQRVDDNDL